ncbi:MAG TPA: type III PLP-dependent enzyme [Paracoccus sp. (in: a-proteobacteria)]|nr:type III PLP-dependent enzyme [Paracoccus sp. (in: a-proteobacteria)]
MLLDAAAQRFGTPAYVYVADIVDRRIDMLRKALGHWFQLSFAMKCNPNPALLRWLEPRIEGLDASSWGEVAAAQAAGWSPDRISFTGPGKRETEIRAAVEAGVGELVIESLREARHADRIAAELGRRQDILVRLSPARVPRGFGDQMAGRPSPFGIDVEDAPDVLRALRDLRHLRIAGLHIYSGTQCLKPEAICENWAIFADVFAEIAERCDLRPERLVFGSGLGIPYFAGDAEIDLAEVAGLARPVIDRLKQNERLAGARLVLELGRFVVGPAGFFVTRVVSVKESRGSRIAVCDGGMNDHLAAAGGFGMVMRRNYRMHRVGGGVRAERIDLVGPLCTSIDRLGSGVELAAVDEGDLIAVHMSGAYGPTASPLHFISHPMPREVLVTGTAMTDVTPGWNN